MGNEQADPKIMLQNLLSEVEGHSEDVYEDHKGVSTIGHGISLRSPSSQKAFMDLGYDPIKIQAGEQQVDPLDLDKVRDNILTQKKDYLDTIKFNNFPNKQLKPNQEAALMSLVYNSPQLIGPQLKKHLNEDKDLDVMKEILLNSNKDRLPGVQLRRLKEAELYGGPLDFQFLMKSLKPEEKKQVYELLNQISNEEHRNQALQKYQQFSPDYVAEPEKPKFFKIANVLGNKKP